MKTNNPVALVTGAARRVGRSIALELARAGCDLIVHYNESRDDALSLAEEIQRITQRCHLVQGDLAEPQSWPRIISEGVDAVGRLDILVNNASVFEPMKLDEFDVDKWDRTMRINLTAVVALCHHAAPHLTQSGQGRIVNITDISAAAPWRKHLHYCASKAALENLTKALARELAPKVTVNAVAPGIAQFPTDYDEAQQARLIEQVPLRRAGTPQEIAQAVRFLCTEAAYITGQVLTIDGGRCISR